MFSSNVEMIEGSGDESDKAAFEHARANLDWQLDDGTSTSSSGSGGNGTNTMA